MIITVGGGAGGAAAAIAIDLFTFTHTYDGSDATELPRRISEELRHLPSTLLHSRQTRLE